MTMHRPLARRWPEWKARTVTARPNETGSLEILPEGGPKRVWLSPGWAPATPVFRRRRSAIHHGGRDEKCQ